MVALLDEEKWCGQRVFISEATLGTVGERLPAFRRRPFGGDGNTNEYLDLIVRGPIGEDRREIPVATVSKSYALIQHREVWEALRGGVRAAGFDADDIPVELRLSEYGERMEMTLRVPNEDFDPGDGFAIALMIECVNSVDRSCAFEVRMRWQRLICSNGWFVLENDALRKIHSLDSMKNWDIGDFLVERFTKVPGEKERYRGLLDWPVGMARIEAWADDVVTKTWGVQAAARVCHIARSGWDGEVRRAGAKVPPHRRQVGNGVEVPGACAPVSNAFHVLQTLSWIASRRPNVEDRIEMARAVPRLMEGLLSGG